MSTQKDVTSPLREAQSQEYDETLPPVRAYSPRSVDPQLSEDADSDVSDDTWSEECYISCENAAAIQDAVKEARAHLHRIEEALLNCGYRFTIKRNSASKRASAKSSQ